MSFKSKLIWAYMAAAAIAPLAAASGTLATAAFAAEKVDKDTFVKTVLSANKFEIDSSKLVLQKSTSEDVKAFAELMIADHTKAGEELWNVITKQGGTPKAAAKEGEQPPAMDLLPKDAAALKTLEGKDGTAFEAAYISLQEDAHSKAVALFQTYASSADDQTWGAFAQKTLPTLEMHLDNIKKIAAMR